MPESPSFTVRQADTADKLVRLALTDMHIECFGEGVQCPSLDQGWWWVAWCDDTPAAFSCLRKARNTPGTAYLSRAGVREKYRGHGLQRRLIHARTRKAATLGFNRVVTDTTDNPASSNNLIACAFRLFTPADPWAFSFSLYWEKSLGASQANRGAHDCRFPRERAPSAEAQVQTG